ncbi:hypothetical protein SELMODRAFT_16609, partial [Selaginella moellendorffii]
RNLISWTALLTAYTQNGHLDRAKRTFQGLLSQDVILWNSIIGGFAQNVESREAIQLFYEMNLVETPDEVTFLCVLLAWSHKGEVFSGRNLFRSICFDFEMAHKKQHYSCFLGLLSRAGYLSEAEELIATMPFAAENLDWTCLLGACKSYRDEKRGSFASQNVLGLDPSNGSAYVLLANLYSAK